MSFNQNLSHFLSQSDAVGQTLFGLLLLMSVTSWYFIAVKAWHGLQARRNSKHFLNQFWNAASLDEVAHSLHQHRDDEPFSHLAYHAISASRHHAKHGKQRLQEAGSASEFLTRAMRRVIDEETAKLEWGLTVLASIASTAPFVGLFGTVWGVYHALIGIGESGQGSLEQIAGPVGEALIMTGLGLAVAIPAVLAYNDCVRSNRVLLAQLDAFAHDLFAFLTTGSAIESGAAPANPAQKLTLVSVGAE
ncbi:MotA/TolQ/ExbB proton channel family protein [Methylomonas sp. SURF-1]|uniref:Biopolymer transport protein ExbB n=1 Tax=Methylomonas aurea TaxID=2952224 RepID=A0ABT1UGN4_9GAMM|nr:MotA/TolQ/ExbB proton channel family protein [Methylomonas sp. SURF-1]MCQ8180874.1 MotA/TolQ/ExbB proton channel family protein [Methylomonas sp. SURF-1]